MDIADWLRGHGLERYAQAFQNAEVTAEVLPELTEADLRELGLPLGPRKMVLKAIQALADPPTTVLLPEAAREEAGSKAVPISVEASGGNARAMNAHAAVPAAPAPAMWMGGVSSSDHDMYIKNLRDSAIVRRTTSTHSGTWQPNSVRSRNAWTSGGR